ncbi:uncharacterized protein LOC131938677 [Physella acuta]|uniref:uncharacterized protein LOC131938677 n=1 Tax=Physella acuta TaxID=109671 RepID=UPI0027DEA28D|nr:uncharacterized protein LOC131938677 [Physella acuta]XP_059152789.1 uncharacterized protein LOC131938677 [Physella acuta]XP_059152790.1 uncharacterized protein LOC131938677 [Physella acuta]
MAANKSVEDEYMPRPNQRGRNITQIGNKITKKGNTVIEIGNTSNVASGDVYQRDNEITEEGNFTYQSGNVTNETEYDEHHDEATEASGVDDSTDQTIPIRGKLRDKHRSILTKEYKFLLEELDAKQLTAHLFSKCIIDLDAQNEILEQKYRKDRTRVLLDKLLDSGPRRAFPEFINCLESEYPHVAKKLKDQM